MGARAKAALTGAAIAADALRYNGDGYVYGGTGAYAGDWDCSSFVSWVLGKDLGLGLPGGTWQEVTRGGADHGPVVLDYASWGGASDVTMPARGDLVIWAGAGQGGHIGIVLGPNRMVSALDTAQGTCVTPISGYGPTGVPMLYRRVNGSSAGPPAPSPGPSAGSRGLLAPLLAGALVAAGMAGATLAAAAGIGLAGAWALAAAARKAATS